MACASHSSHALLLLVVYNLISVPCSHAFFGLWRVGDWLGQVGEIGSADGSSSNCSQLNTEVSFKTFVQKQCLL